MAIKLCTVCGSAKEEDYMMLMNGKYFCCMTCYQTYYTAQNVRGANIEFQKGDTCLQWRYVNEATWNDLIPLTELKGADGVNGVDGVAGAQGLQGLQGVQGEKGDRGDQGIQGETGLQGAQGAQGIKGDKGDIGAQGIQGLKGDTGSVGDQGIQGIPGYTPIKGVDYFDGAVGAKGDKGEKGDTGVQGIQGTQGIKGDTGAQGIQGVPGTNGTNGYTPVKGIDYFDGATGAKGDTGSQGIQGIQGIQGVKGDTGSQGPAGTTGFCINVQALTSSPTDAQTIYFGMLPKAPTTTAATSKIYIRKTCALKYAEIYCYSGTAGTNESWSLYVRKNNTTDTLIATLGVATSERVFTNAALNVSLVAGDYLEIKSVNPTWATNPLTTIFGGYLYFEG